MIKHSAAEPKWVSMRHLQHFAARASAAGMSLDALLVEAGLPLARLTDAEGLIPLSALESMLGALTRHHDIPLLGLHLANDIQPATFGALGFITQACKTFDEVLDIMIRFRGLLSNIGELTVEHGPGTVIVRWDCLAGSEAFRRQASEYVLGAFVMLARFLLPQQRHFVRAVHFTHAPPENVAHNHGYFTFFNCPVYFDQPTSAVVLRADILKARMPHSDAMLKDLLEAHATKTLKKREYLPDLAEEVRHLIRTMLVDGTPGRDMVATQLGMSRRSLHRKLQVLGTSYREILNDLRLSLANQRLLREGASVNDTAACLGFASHQAFLRWFRQSTGMTPSEYRTAKGVISRGENACLN